MSMYKYIRMSLFIVFLVCYANAQGLESQDPQTKRVVEILSGKSNLNNIEIAEALRDIQYYLKAQTGMSFVLDPKISSESGNYTEYCYKVKILSIVNEDSKLEAKRCFWIQTKGIFSKPKYDAINYLLNSYNNPKVRFRPWYLETLPQDFGRARYLFRENTIEIPIIYNYDILLVQDLAIESLIAELAHCKQFKADFKEANKRFEAGVTRAVAEADKAVSDQTRKTKEYKLAFRQAYLSEYSLPDSLEYEAHEKIQPEIKNEYKFTLKVLSMDWELKIPNQRPRRINTK